jgi:hypothetical protein
VSVRTVDCVRRGGGEGGREEGSSREGEEGNECVRTDAGCPRGRWSVSVRTRFLPRVRTVKTRLQGKRGRGRMSGR